ncbi:hypothetical protein [Ekhidna sp.]|uniref:hypothetical protein n=1 Tax=Ekhidna sp. TaxID=2608089 RepID=UPI003B5C6115
MKDELTLKEKGAKKLFEWKQFVHELNEQLHHEVSDAKEEFERQKKKLRTWLDSLENDLDHAIDVSKEKAEGIKASIEELRVQAALGRAEAEDLMHDQQKKLVKGLHDLKHKIHTLYDSSKEDAQSFKEKVEDKVDDFHTRFDLFRLQWHLGMTEARQEWKEKKKELSHRLHEVNTKLDHLEEEASDKWTGFSSEMSEAWDHFKKAFKS